MEKDVLSTIQICEHDCHCCMDLIYSSIKNEADKWNEMGEKQFADTPLHCAAALGNTAVAVEVLNLMPSLGRKLNKEGQSALHLAIAAGHRDTARTLAWMDKQLVRVKGKEGLTPLMQSAAKAVDEDGLKLLACLLVACPESVTDVNNRHQTVVHVALENQHCDAVCLLVDWLRRRDQISSVLTVKDGKGNTVLHAAAQFGCVKGAKKLVDIVKLNRRNDDKETALDLAKEHKQNEEEEILKRKKEVAEILINKGAMANKDIKYHFKSTVEHVLTDASNAEALSRAYYYLSKELTLEMRSAILVVAALIVAATYQAVLQPPGGLYPPDTGSNSTSTSTATTLFASRHMQRQVLHRRLASGDKEALRNHTAGKLVMEKKHYRLFIPSNTFAFALSTVIIIFVVPGSPVFLILHLCLVFMCVSYLLALDSITPNSNFFMMIYSMALFAIVGAFAVKLFYYPVKALLVDEDWWLRRFSIKVANWTSKFDTSKSNALNAVMATTLAMKKQHRVLGLK